MKLPFNHANLKFRSVCSKVHLYFGLILGLVAVVISLTGSLLVFRAEIDRLLNPELLRVAPEMDPVSLEQIMHAAVEAVPEGTPRLIRFPRSAVAPYEVWLTDNRQIYVDPGSGDVLGVRGYEEGLMNSLFALHTKLFAGETGELVIGVAGLLMLVLALTGLVLWWPAVSIRWRRLRKGLIIVWRRGPWRLNYDLHRAGGFYSSLFLVLVAVTGCALVFSAQAGALLNAVAGSAPLPPPPTVDARPVDAHPFDFSLLDGALNTARAELPEAVATFVSLPVEADAPLTVRMRTPPELHPNGRSYVYLDPRNGLVLRTDNMRFGPLGARLLHAAYPLHIGSVGGAVARILYVLLGLAPAMLSVTGTLIWYRRWRRTNASDSMQRPGRSDGHPPACPDLSRLPTKVKPSQLLNPAHSVRKNR